MEEKMTLEQAIQELEQARRELREVKEQYTSAQVESKDATDASSPPGATVNPRGMIEYPTDHPHIYTNPEMHGGEPTIRGSGIMVRSIIERLQAGQDPSEIHRAFPILNLAKIYDAISFYYDHTLEIDTSIRENEEAQWRLTHRVST
jgi:uncharacterized protein (DUF433 family)